jgi:prolyl-tRNA synthetase
MKDLYSFDLNADKAMETYNEVRKAYDSFFTELGAPFIVAEADSGNMGGNLSHEYHYESPLGEDIVWTCSNCTYVANDEVVFRKSTERPTNNQSDNHQAKIWRGITIDRTANVTVIYPTNDIKNTKGSLGALDSTMLKQIYPQIDLTIKSLSPNAPEMVHQIVIKHPQVPNKTLQDFIDLNLISGNALQIATEKDFLRTKDGDLCPRCETGLLRSHHTIELGHTFFLGTRYSNPFRLAIVDPNSVHGGNVSPNIVQMGCYGIGVSRLIGALAEIGTREITFGTRKTQYGLNWPTPVAPFEVAIIYNMDDHSREAQRIYDSLCVPIAANAPVPDVVLDDRARGIPWKLTDADMRGYPVLLILGNKMPEYVEVQCKALGLKALVSPYDLKKHVYSALHSLKQNYLSPQKGSKPVKTLQFGPGMEKVEMAQMAEIAEMPRSDSTSEVNLSREKALNRHRLKPTKDERIVKTADGGLVEVRRFTPAIIRGYETSKGKRGGIS